MAQTLKDNLRNEIIQAAKEEFLEHGYDGASMRRIAAKSHMTVGNLYRYFKNKEDINLQIVGGTYEKINSLIKKLTSNKLSFETSVYNMRLDVNALRDIFDNLADELVNIYMQEPVEFSILMLHSNLSKELEEWFADVIKKLIMQSYTIDEFEHFCDILSHCFSLSIFSGVRELFATSSDVTADELKMLLKVYFRTYLYTLDTDIRIFLD